MDSELLKQQSLAILISCVVICVGFALQKGQTELRPHCPRHITNTNEESQIKYAKIRTRNKGRSRLSSVGESCTTQGGELGDDPIP